MDVTSTQSQNKTSMRQLFSSTHKSVPDFNNDQFWPNAYVDQYWANAYVIFSAMNPADKDKT
jgi:hypothetical protein